MADRHQIEDALGYLYRASDEGQTPGLADLARELELSAVAGAELAAALATEQLARQDEQQRLTLTDTGQSAALRVIRAHRLYETWLARRTGYTAADWHGLAHDAEHRLTAEEIERLARGLGEPLFDPHGDPIPTAAGELPPNRGWGLDTAAAGQVGRITHVEDEPPATFRLLSQHGFAPDIRLRVDRAEDSGLLVRILGQEVPLTTLQAASVQCLDLRAGETFDEQLIRLVDLRPGERADVVSISPQIRGLARSRLLDLGVVPGTTLEITLVGPGGDPVAYNIRGANIALRAEQRVHILVHRALPGAV